MNRFSVFLVNFVRVLILALFLVGNVWGEETVLVVYSEPAAEVYLSTGEQIGSSGKPFRLELPVEGTVELTLKADGFEPKTLNYTAEELRKSKRVPPQGVVELESGSSMMTVGLIVATVALCLVGFLLTRRKKPKAVKLERTEARFVKGKRIGEGASAQVFAATSAHYQNRQLAVKILKTGEKSEDSSRARLLRSLEKSLELSHPNLVKLFESGETPEGEPYILMELLEGDSLENALKKEAPVSAERALELVAPLCDVLDYLHEQTIIHRDVKPENIFLTRSGNLKLMDLEISRSAESRDLTQTGVVVGTPLYLAPEHIRGSAGPASDQYACGVILFEMLTGKRPFQGSEPLETINMHLQDAPPSIMALNPNVSSLQEAVVMKMLAKEPKNRFRDMKAAKEAMEEAFLGGGEDDQTGTAF